MRAHVCVVFVCVRGAAQARWLGGAHGSKVVGGGVFRCCVPWCGARTAAPADDADYALREGSPQLSNDEYGKLFYYYYLTQLEPACGSIYQYWSQRFRQTIQWLL